MLGYGSVDGLLDYTQALLCKNRCGRFVLGGEGGERFL